MAEQEWLNRLSVATFFLSSIVILLIVTFGAYYLGRANKHRVSSPPSDFVSTNVLGLLALILGFSFSMANERYENRRALAVQEANAVGTAYLRSQAINFKSHAPIKKLFQDYVALRVKAYESLAPRVELKEIERVSQEIWRAFIKVSQKDRGELESAYMVSLNEMFDTANSRTLALFKMMPTSFYFLILILAAAAVGFMNFDRGINNGTDHIRSILFVILFSILFSFIYDMDHFRSGILRINQAALLEIQKNIR